MSILVRFTVAPSLTSEDYDTTQARIEASGKFPPDGLELHVAFSAGGNFRVSEIWDSKEQFDAFGEHLDADPHRKRRRARGSPGGNRDPQHHQEMRRYSAKLRS